MIKAKLAEWEDEAVQIVYAIICAGEAPSDPNEHWEGFMARKIVGALRQARPKTELPSSQPTTTPVKITITEAEVEAFMASAEVRKLQRAELMPTEQDAAVVMCDAYQRLKELGWKETMYGPTNVTVQLIEPGSSGIHQGQRWEPWPEKTWWIDNDSPSNPCLFKPARPK